MSKEITIAFDGGTSSSKVVASYPSTSNVFNDDKFFLINSGVRQLTKKNHDYLLNCLEGDIGLNASLVSFIDPKSSSLVYWEVGESVSRQGLLTVEERKFEALIVKLLAFTGYLINLSSNHQSSISLNLGVLLPLDEIEDRRTLAKWLREIINQNGFTVNGKSFNKVQLDKINVKPEGFGLYKTSAGESIGVLMMGHSDCSWLYFSNGFFSPQFSRTLPGTGMHGLIENLRFPVQNELTVAKTIAEAGKECDRKVLIELTQTKSEDEYSQLIEAISVARSQYWQDRQRDWQFLNIESVDSLVVGGGAAYYFATELKDVFKENYGLKISWGKQLKKDFCDRFGVKSSDKVANLFIDCYGYFQTISNEKTGMATIEQPALRVLKNGAN